MKSKKINKEKLRIAFDGYGASGKSLGAKLISKKYKLKLLNSGLLYRYAAFLILKKKPDKKISFIKKKFSKLNYENLSSFNLQSQEISDYSAVIAKQKKIRLVLKQYQKKFAKKFNRIAIEGRDISTKILPKSDLNILPSFTMCAFLMSVFTYFQFLKKLLTFILITPKRAS